MSVIPTYIGKCCREWILMIGGRGRCGLCGERPTYERDDCCEFSYHCPQTGDVECKLHSGFDTCCQILDCPGNS